MTSLLVPKLKSVNSDGRAKKVTIAIPAVMRTVEIRSCCFSDGSIWLSCFISKRSVAKSVVIKQTIIPIELMVRGYNMADKSWVVPKDDIEATKRAAQDDSAYEPNRSEPIPVIIIIN